MIDKIEKAIGKGIRFLSAGQRPDGAMEPSDKGVLSCYKAVLAFALNGKLHAAKSLAAWMVRVLSTDDGRLRGAGSLGMFHDKFHTYTQAWIAQGLLRGGCYAQGQKIVDWLVSQQDPGVGGFSSLGPVEGGPRQFDTLCTGMDALACLAAGRLEEARRAGDFLVAFVEAQPADGKVFYSSADENGKLLTEFPEETKALYRIDTSQPSQLYFFYGTPAVFLSQLYELTGDERHLRTAISLLDRWDRCGEPAYRSLASGKSGCAAAHLYRIAGEDRFREMALGVARYLLSVQSDEGAWPGGQVDPPSSISAEMIVWLSEILACV